MNCLLINYGGLPKSLNTFCPDNGLALLSAILNQSGAHKAYILDYCSLYFTRIWGCCFNKVHNNKMSYSDNYYACQQMAISILIEEITKFIKENNVNTVGFKLWTGDGFAGSCKIAEALKKEFPNLFIIAGGPHVDYFRDHIYRYTDVFDCIVCADGEYSLQMLIENYNKSNNWQAIPNLIYKKDGKILSTTKQFMDDLNINPSPDYSSSTYLTIKDKLNFFVIEDSRGCSNSCYFCIEPLKSGRGIRTRDVEKVFTDIKQTSEVLQSSAFRFSCSTPNIKHRKSLCQKMIDENLNMKYASFQTAKGLDSEYANLLKKSGCYNVFIGVESFSEKLLTKSFGKSQTYAEISSAITTCKKADIYTLLGLIYPAPLEDNVSSQITFSALKDLKPDAIFAVYPIIAPYTQWGESHEKYDIKIPDPDNYFLFNMMYNIEHTKNVPEEWRHIEGITVNDMDYLSLKAELMKLLKHATDANIATQISIELPLLAHILGTSAQTLNSDFHSALAPFENSQIESLIIGLNKKLYS